jgi:hypothetical protein
MDAALLTFIDANNLTILASLGLLKVIATITPWAEDDQIVQMLTDWYKSGP